MEAGAEREVVGVAPISRPVMTFRLNCLFGTEPGESVEAEAVVDEGVEEESETTLVEDWRLNCRRGASAGAAEAVEAVEVEP